MILLIELALKSLLVAAGTLALLRLLARRSAAERSLIAHLGLLALVLLPLAGLALPSLALPVPTAWTLTYDQSRNAPTSAETGPEIAPTTAAIPADRDDIAPAAAAGWTPFAYAAPALGLLLMTVIALYRLIALGRSAEVLVEPVWLSALAHAQRRMGLKSGTALLVSDALPSPISWGWARPVILLNREALTAADEAEAIIAHELAHVVSLDWAKLMLARCATALFWFNPLVWVIAREAHQLREEAADDAVLATAIPGTDYAQLLLEVARHEARGLLLGAHGVAPAKGSLRRRVGRVLDTSLARGPAGRSWVAGFGAGMLVMAAPLAALTVAPTLRGEAVAPVTAEVAVAASQPPDRPGRPPRSAEARAIENVLTIKALGVTPAYVAAIEAAAPWLGRLSDDDAIELKALGIAPDYIRSMEAAGLTRLRKDDLIAARAVGLTGGYVRSMRRVGQHGLERLIQLRTLGVGPEDLARDIAGQGNDPPE